MAQPVFSTAPSIAGNPFVGQTLTATDAASAGNTITRQWYREDAAIPGATASTYVLTAADRNRAISVQTIATSGDPLVTTIFSSETRCILDQPTLGSLVLSGSLTAGIASSGTISGDTPGSTITNNVTGLTVNSSARTYSYNGTGTPQTVANGLVETLSGATGSPKNTPQLVSGGSLSRLVLTKGLVSGTPASGAIQGATPGSTITSNIASLVVDSANRTFAWDGSDLPNIYSNALTEALATAVNSPRSSRVTVLQQAIGGRIPLLNPVLPLITAFYAAGDSRTDGAWDDQAGRAYKVGGGSSGNAVWPVWVEVYGSGRVRFSGLDGATGGSTTDDLRYGKVSNPVDARTWADKCAEAITQGAQCIGMMISVNDITSDMGSPRFWTVEQSIANTFANLIWMVNYAHDQGLYVLLFNEAPKGDYTGSGGLNYCKRIWTFLTDARRQIVHSSGYTNIIIADSLNALIQPGTGFDGNQTFLRKTETYRDTLHFRPRAARLIGKAGWDALLGSGRVATTDQARPPVANDAGITANPYFALRTGSGSAQTGPINALSGWTRPDNYSLNCPAGVSLACYAQYGSDPDGTYMELRITGDPGAANPLMFIACSPVTITDGLKFDVAAKMKVMPGAVGLVYPQVSGTAASGSPINDAKTPAGRPTVSGGGTNNNSTGTSLTWEGDGVAYEYFTAPINATGGKTSVINLIMSNNSDVPIVDFTVRIYWLRTRLVA